LRFDKAQKTATTRTVIPPIGKPMALGTVAKADAMLPSCRGKDSFLSAFSGRMIVDNTCEPIETDSLGDKILTRLTPEGGSYPYKVFKK
jgi:hypothetical protein